jgi:hypothetical protein
MKHPIKWYEENILNSDAYADRLRDQAARLIDEAFRIEEHNRYLQYQIDLAREKGLEEFDGDRFGIKRGRNNNGQK